MFFFLLTLLSCGSTLTGCWGFVFGRFAAMKPRPGTRLERILTVGLFLLRFFLIFFFCCDEGEGEEERGGGEEVC